MRYHSSKMFDFSKEHNTFYSEVSMLEQSFGEPIVDRVHNDSCDLGFAMVSSRTGQEAVFVVSEHNESEMVLVPTTDTIRRIPALRRARVVVFND